MLNRNINYIFTLLLRIFVWIYGKNPIGVISLTVMLFRSFITYLLLLTVLRLMGKRQIGELQPSELVTTLLLSEVASQTVTDNNIPLVYGLVPVIAILSFEVILSFLITKSKRFKKIMTGNPSVLIEKGKLNLKEMEKNRISLEEIAAELRLKDIPDISSVQYAIMEKNGRISAVLKAEDQPLTRKDLNIKCKETGIQHALIVDGEINYDNLKASKKTLEFIKEELKKRNISSYKNVLLLTCNDAEEVYIIERDQ